MEENNETLAVIIATSAGAFSILASLLNWNFFFENKKAQLFVKLFGRNGSRVFYFLLGCFLIYIAFKI